MKEVHVSNVPWTATEEELKHFLERMTNPGAVCSCELRRDSFQTRHKGFGFVTFSDDEVAERVQQLATIPYRLNFQGRSLRINVSKRQVKHNPEHSITSLQAKALSMGCLTGDTFHI
jgi:RNA recognition motif-containing protein